MTSMVGFASIQLDRDVALALQNLKGSSHRLRTKALEHRSLVDEDLFDVQEIEIEVLE